MLADLVYETSTSTGTGNFTLSSVTGWVSFNNAFGTGGTDAFYYFIRHKSADEWEVGTGHLSASTTLVRDTVLASSNSDAAVSFSAGTKEVTCDLPADFQGLLSKGGNTLAPHENLVVKYATAATVDIDADAVTVFNGLSYRRLTSVNLTVNIASSGANGLDTGTEANSTWYHLFVIWNGTTAASLASASATAPTLPSGYTHFARVAAIRNNGSGDFIAMHQIGTHVQQPIQNAVTTGSATSATEVDISALVPTTAKAVKFNVIIFSSSGTNAVSVLVQSDSTAAFGRSYQGQSTVDTAGIAVITFTPLITAQTFWYLVAGTNARTTLQVLGWDY